MTVTTDERTLNEPPVAIPETVESAEAKLLYLSLRLQGGQTIDELQRTTKLPKLSLYSIVRSLRRNDLVEKDGDSFRIAGE
ncbi:helix-turn-helix domain-containing protein [Halosolutus gelatinilyticus]|uniref:helix-turn-helix domain-containing protein n=1 Tax=Halosolutus gelatinilyticus TaxID=2931975 RepID=UPI001FF3D0CF|nr:helix-turn-helix domain-containing protein [Halosolutus gelatinilyticus]